MENINDIFKSAQSINLYRGGVKTQYVPAELNFNLILNGFEKMIKGARNMPAFGVSLHDETSKALSRGMWVEFCFGTARTFAGMGYQKLLVEVNYGHSGFNIIRYVRGAGYSGRCYYLDLTGDMSEFYTLLQGIA